MTRRRPIERDRPAHLLGAIDVAAAALGGALRTVAGVHAAIAAQPFAALRPLPALGEASAPARVVHDGITAAVYAGIAAGIEVAAGAARIAATALPDREPRPGSLAGAAVAALNGFAGDRLARDGNRLAADMGLRHRGQRLAVRRASFAAALPGVTPRVALFVHGLACNEALWWRHAERHYGDRRTSHGARLQRERGVTPLYLRYNSGLPIADNGRRLARLLDRLVREWPLPIDELVLVGHSMGGLVVRAALRRGGAWTRPLRHVFYLGSPHRGAPLAKAAHTGAWLLDRLDVTRPLGAVLGARSSGVRDLRHGIGGEVPLRESVHHHFIAATLTRDRRHPLAAVIGDGLVRLTSATSEEPGRAVTVRHFGGLSHLDLLNHPAVYDYLRASWAAGASGRSPG